MNNPFEQISKELAEVKSLLGRLLEKPSETKVEDCYISEEELCKRFNISRPTARRWSKEKNIKVLRFGSAKRYRWSEVLKKLDK